MGKVVKTARALPVAAVSGALVFAAATEWAGFWWPVELLSHFRVFVLAACLLGTLVFLIFLSLGRVLLGVGVAIWLAWPMIPYVLPPEAPVLDHFVEVAEATGAPLPQKAGRGPEITVALWNMRVGNHWPDLMETVLSWDADVVVLLEAWPDFYRANYQAARERYPTHHARPEDSTFGLWAFTRLPVRRDLCLTRQKALGGLPACDWTLGLAGGESIRLVAVHPPPPVGEAPSVLRHRVLRDVAEPFIESGDLPGLLVGDLNCTPWSAWFVDLTARAGLRDSGLGRGLWPTWEPGGIAGLGLAIDHVLVSPRWEVVDRRLPPAMGSDHRPVVVRLRLNAGQPEVAGAGG